MFVFLLALCIVSLYKIKIAKWNDSYLGLQETTALKGFFVGLVFLSHLRTYLDPSLGGRLDRYALLVLNLFGQLMVAYFFFCSGYGVMLSLQTKKDYETVFFRHRLLKTLVHFDIAILLYLLLSVCIGKQYDLKQYLFCWIGWESIGNSNWFIFVILMLYLITLISFRIKKETDFGSFAMLMVITVLCIGLWIGLYLTKSSYWYNTLLCYPAGMCIAIRKEWLDCYMKRRGVFWTISCCTLVIFVITYKIPNQLAYSMCSIAFCFVVMLASIKIEIRSSVLLWMGNYLFEIYILQRIPMIVCSYIEISNQYLFGVFSIIVTIILAILYKMVEKKVDKLLRL